MAICSRAEILAFCSQTSGSEQDLALVDFLQPQVERAVMAYVGHDITQQSHTELLPASSAPSRDTLLADWDVVGNHAVAYPRRSGSNRLYLRHVPVIPTGLQVYEDTSAAYAGQGADAFGADTLLTAGTDYYLDLDTPTQSTSGCLIRIGGTWSTEARSIKADYTGGYSTEQLYNGEAADLRLAVIQCCAKAYWQLKAMGRTGGAGSIISESVGKYSYSVSQAGSVMGGMITSIPPECREILDRYKVFPSYL